MALPASVAKAGWDRPWRSQTVPVYSAAGLIAESVRRNMRRGYAIHMRSTSLVISTARVLTLSVLTSPDEAWPMTYERNRALGRYGERVAADHLQSLGMV